MRDRIIYRVKAKPNARRASVAQNGNILNVKIDAPPRERKANQRLLEILSKYFGVPKTCIKFVSGRTSKNKTIEITAK